MENGSGRSSSKVHRCGNASGWRFFLLAAAAGLAILFGQAGPASAAAYFATGSMGAPRQDHTATLLDDGTVLVTGGVSTSSATLTTAEIYDPSTGTFSPTSGNMGTARQRHTATKLANGKVLIAGGFTGSTVLNSAEIYDPATKTFTPTGNMAAPGRQLHTATLLGDGRVLMAGGRSTNVSSGTLASAELFDPATGQFTATGAMSTARAFHTGSRLTADGRVLIAGGLTIGLASLNTAEIYDPVAGTFAPTTGPMQAARNYHDAVVLNDGRVLLTGGTSSGVGPSLTTAELFDPTAGTFAAAGGAPGMLAGHSRHASVLLADGSVLVAGDFSEAGVPGAASAVFLLDFGEVFQPRDPMLTPRSNFPAVRLANGTVLITGGATGVAPTAPTAAAELYDPSSVRVVPAGHAFPDTVIGTTSAPQAFTISTNAGIAIAPFTITGTDATRFTVSNTTCSTQPVPPIDPENPPPPSLPGGASCTVSVTFTPGTLGPKSASLIILTDDLSIPTWTIPLSGNGVPVPPVVLTVTSPVGGTVTGTGIACPGDCSESFTNGTGVTLTANASAGFQFAGWSGACAPSGTNPVCTIAALTANATVSAAFADVTAPILTLSTLPDGASTANEVLNIAGSVTDNGGVTTFTINGTAVVFDVAGSFSHALKLAAGANIITGVAADAAGNTTTATRTITLDPTVPALAVTAPADNSATSASLIPVTGTADAAATLTLTVNGGTPLPLILTGTDFTSSSDIPLAPGINTLVITAEIPGGKTATAKRTVIFDAALPTLAVTDPNQDTATIQRQGFTIGGTAVGLTPVTVTITVPVTPPAVFTPPVTGGAFTQLVNFTVSKTYPITVTATDENSNTVTTIRNILFGNPVDGNMDLSADGNVTIADALMALRAAVGLITPTAEQKLHGDVAPLLNGTPNPDGVVNIADALLILRKVVGLLTW